MKQNNTLASTQCVTLDLDDTLWPVEPTLVSAENALYEWMEVNFPRLTESYTQQQIAAKRLANADSYPDIEHNVTEIRYRSLRDLGTEFGFSDDFAHHAMEVFRYHRNLVTPYAASEPVLSALKPHFLLGAITNGNAQLEYIPIGRYFDFCITAEQAGVSKPHSEMFERAANLANVPIAHVLHVGDSAHTDVLGAMKAGCKAVWFNNKREVWPGGQNPHYVIHCLSELPKLLNIPFDN